VGEGVMAGWRDFSSFGGGLLAGMGAEVVRFGLEAEEGTGGGNFFAGAGFMAVRVSSRLTALTFGGTTGGVLLGKGARPMSLSVVGVVVLLG